MRKKILIVDDETTARYAMRKALQVTKAEIKEAADGHDALHLMQSFAPDIVLCDIKMPRLNGLELLKAVSELKMQRDIPPFIVMVTAYGSEKIAVEAMKAGAYDYLSKPYDIDELRLLVNKIIEQIELKRENIKLRHQVSEQRGQIIGSSPAIHHILGLVEKVAPTDVTVLITGESGTGKELLAHTIHRSSPRANGPYVTMNCAAIPKDLVESELFGHEKGAFTGAVDQRQGKFELAHNGTLFLDEIADMSLDTQAKILRVLEDKSFTRLGGKDVIQTDVRLLSATNKNLAEEIQRGRFRQDLYYRLKVIELAIPPLRDRREDIPVLVNHYVQHYAERHNKNVNKVDSAAMRLLFDFDWPGNIRQLIHMLEQAVVLSDDDRLTVNDLPAEIQGAQPQGPPEYQLGEESFTDIKEKVVNGFERRIVHEALTRCNGNVSQAARLLQMKRQFLQTKMKNLGIERDEFI